MYQPLFSSLYYSERMQNDGVIENRLMLDFHASIFHDLDHSLIQIFYLIVFNS